MKVLGIIPARGGSKRLPRKNVQTIDGVALVVRALKTALAAATLTKVVVSSDDEEILGLVRRVSVQAVLRRPAALAGDESKAIEYVRHALHFLESDTGDVFDAVAIVQPTTPGVRPEDIDATVARLWEAGAETSVSVVKLDQLMHPLKLKTWDGVRLHPYIEGEGDRFAAQELPEVFVRNGGVYVTRRSVLDRGVVISADSTAHIMPREFSVDINDPIDLAFARFLLEGTAARAQAS